MKRDLPAEFARYSGQQVSDYLTCAGLVAMNLVLAPTDQGIGSNIILGFDRVKSQRSFRCERPIPPRTLDYSGLQMKNWNELPLASG